MADLAEVIPLPTNEAGDPVVPLDGVPERQDVLTYDPEAPNLVEAFMASDEGKEELKKIAERVRKDFDADWEAGKEYRERMADDIRLFVGELPEKEWPFKNAARAHVPIVLENVTRLAFRMESELFGDWSNVFGVQPVGPDDRDVAEILSLHGNWQLREKIDDFPRQMSMGLLGFILIGDITYHSYWDPTRKTNCHEFLTPEEFVTPFSYKTTKPDYSDLPHYTKVFRKYRHEMLAMKGIWFDVDAAVAKRQPSWDDEPDEPIREAMREVMGEERPDEGEAPYKLLWYEGWLELPQMTKAHWCQVILDHDTKSILSLAIHEEVNWEDRLRYERQQAEMEQYRQQMIAQKEAELRLLELEQQFQMGAATGMLDPMAGMAMQEEMSMLGMQAQQTPMPPSWLGDPQDLTQEPDEPRKDPIYMFAHGTCVESLSGNLGLSFGRILGDFNRAADTMLSQGIDAATLQNASPFITSEQVEFTSPFEAGPGKMNKVTGVSGSLKDHIMPLQFQAANPQLFEQVDRMYGYGQSSVQAPAVLSGEPGKSGETYRGISARIEQATKQISVATGKFARCLKTVLRNNARLNAVYMPDEELFSVLNHMTGQYDMLQVGRKLYERDYRVEIRSDLRFLPQAQRIQEADELVQLPAACPPMQGNFAFLHHALVNSLKARNAYEFIPLLGPAPPPPDTPLGLPREAFPVGSPFGLSVEEATARQMAAMQQQAAGSAPPGGDGPSPQPQPGPSPEPPQSPEPPG